MKINNNGTLGRNDRKTKDNHPDFRGSAMVDGVEYWLAAWVKQGPSGRFFSLAFTPKDDSESVTPPKKHKEADPDDFDDDIPF